MLRLSDLYVLTDEQRKNIGLSIVVAIAALEPSGTPQDRAYALSGPPHDRSHALSALYKSLRLLDEDEYQLQMKNHGRVE